LISIAHRRELFQFHDWHLTLEGGGQWSLTRISQ